MLEKLEQIEQTYDELTAKLADPDVLANPGVFRDTSRALAELNPVVELYQRYKKTRDELDQTAQLLGELQRGDDMYEMAAEEKGLLEETLASIEETMKEELAPKDPNEKRNAVLEIRAGTGGDEAAIFAGDLFRMYTRYSEARGWKQEIIQMSEGEHGGYKEIVCRLAGKRVFSYLRFESGAHRVQRVPETESQGRIHTSACTVAVLPEAEETGEIEIDPGDLRVDTYRASGAGGQHVNKTDSAVRLTHLPTGIVVECQDERSQHKNRARALSLLRARLLDAEQSRLEHERAEERRSQVGSGDRSERIRTYNFPQGRVTDHRINLSLYKLPQIMEGDLDGIIEPLRQHMEAEQLATLDPG